MKQLTKAGDASQPARNNRDADGRPVAQTLPVPAPVTFDSSCSADGARKGRPDAEAQQRGRFSEAHDASAPNAAANRAFPSSELHARQGNEEPAGALTSRQSAPRAAAKVNRRGLDSQRRSIAAQPSDLFLSLQEVAPQFNRTVAHLREIAEAQHGVFSKPRFSQRALNSYPRFTLGPGGRWGIFASQLADFWNAIRAKGRSYANVVPAGQRFRSSK